MKTWLIASKELLTQRDIVHNSVKITQNIDKLWISIVYEPTKWKMVDKITEWIWDEYDSSEQKIYTKDWREMKYAEVWEFVLSMFYWWIQRVSQNKEFPFTWYIKEARDNFKQYIEKKYNVKNNETYYEVSNEDFIRMLQWLDISSDTSINNDWYTLWEVKNSIDKILDIVSSTKEKINIENNSPIEIDKPLLDQPKSSTKKVVKKDKSSWSNPLVYLSRRNK